METLVNFFLLILLVVIAVTALRLRDLFGTVMLLGIYSLGSASLFVVLDAVDVAFTEASVGAGVSTVFMLGALALTTHQEKPQSPHKSWWPLLIVTVTGLVLAYGIWDIPPYGDAANPIHQHLVGRFLEDSPKEIGLPNVVTSVLASYRGYDTLGETTVVFTAAIGVLILIGGGLHRRSKEDEATEKEESE